MPIQAANVDGKKASYSIPCHWYLAHQRRYLVRAVLDVSWDITLSARCIPSRDRTILRKTVTLDKELSIELSPWVPFLSKH